MAIVKLDNLGKEYQGFSNEGLPPTPADGATFHVVDTGEVYVAHNGDWLPDLRSARALRIAALL
jgi:hypothetical protein